MAHLLALGGIIAIASGCASKAYHEQNAEVRDKRIEITVAANSDLWNALTRLATQYETENKRIKVTLVFAASGVLWSQAKGGTPFDGLIVGSSEYLRDLKTIGKPMILAYGKLAFYGDSPPQSLEELEHFQGTLVIANPDTAPYGKLAETLLKSKRWYEKLREQMIIAKNVHDAKLEVDRGTADLGLISLTQALEGPKRYSLVETSLQVTITCAALKAGEVETFLNWLTLPKQQSVFAQYGLQPAHIAEVHRPKEVSR